MAILSTGKLMDALRQHAVLSSERLAELPNLARGRQGSARDFAKSLIQKGWLSVYQVNELLAGRGQELVIGPYYVLEKLGQGGLSWVFRAQHKEHGHHVAIKMIRPEVFASAAGRQQFLLEVEAMARLDHPNIVQFCDADEFGSTYYFAMEYVEGTDLGKVVRLSGALPAHEACDYIRQAALGLQHAHERNLIHRDIKPVNLFRTQVSLDTRAAAAKLFATKDGPAAPTRAALQTMLTRHSIKVLDWGLACLRNSTGLTPDQQLENGKSLVGTADYISPEQARNANQVDIRGDIYSLGCSLYYLLTGQAPFPDGALMQKIMAHQTAEPKPIGDFRADVPAGLIAIVKRMMAKTPEARFQTPASAALALLPFTRASAILPINLGTTPVRGRTQANRDDTPLPPKLAAQPNPDRASDAAFVQAE